MLKAILRAPVRWTVNLMIFGGMLLLLVLIAIGSFFFKELFETDKSDYNKEFIC